MSAWKNEDLQHILLRLAMSCGYPLRATCRVVDTAETLGNPDPLQEHETLIVYRLAAEALVQLEVAPTAERGLKLLRKWSKPRKASEVSAFLVNIAWCTDGLKAPTDDLDAERVGWLCQFVQKAFPELEQAFEFMAAYAKFHFEKEEARMDGAKYPYLETHKAAHRSFLNRLEELGERLRDHDPPGEVARRAAEFGVDWFTRHIRLVDMPFIEILRGDS